jgi:hypothetical protein
VVADFSQPVVWGLQDVSYMVVQMVSMPVNTVLYVWYRIYKVSCVTIPPSMRFSVNEASDWAPLLETAHARFL